MHYIANTIIFLLLQSSSILAEKIRLYLQKRLITHF